MSTKLDSLLVIDVLVLLAVSIFCYLTFMESEKASCIVEFVHFFIFSLSKFEKCNFTGVFLQLYFK